MIKTHEFNTRWWGKPVGIVTEPGFFAAPEPEQKRLLERFFRLPGTTEGRVTVHNIHATIGACFLNPTGHWLWIA